MAILQVAEDLIDSDILEAVFCYLEREYNAKINKPFFSYGVYEFYIKSESLPKGMKSINVTVTELVPKVLIINVSTC